MPRQIVLASRPSGWPTEDNFALTETGRPDLADGQVRVRNLFMSVDPYMRGRMNDVKSYVPPFRLGEPLEGGAIGTVTESRSPDLAKGDLVLHMLGWRDEAVLPAPQARKVAVAKGLSPSVYLGVLGMPTLTAYVGVLDIAQLKVGETVFVSGAAGAVGSMAGQIAKLKGAGRVIGSAGTEEKVRWLREIGFDVAFNYRSGSVVDQLRQAAPDGIDVYFDNVGLVVTKRLTLRGFIIVDHQHRTPDMVADVSAWLRDGKLTHAETVVDGLGRAPGAFIGLLRGANTGKMLVRL